MRQFGKCIPFEFAGCGGNENRFDTQHECEWHCRGLIAPQSSKLEKNSQSTPYVTVAVGTTTKLKLAISHSVAVMA